MNDTQTAAVADFVLGLKKETLANYPLPQINKTLITVDSPIPFCLHKLWFELHKREHHTLIPTPGAADDQVEPAYVCDNNGNPYSIR